MEESRRTAILQAAIQVFARYGYKKASMDEVARGAGLSRPGLYLHFPSKEALFRDAVDLLVEKSLADLQAALDAPGELEARVVAALVAANGPFVGHSMDAAHFAELLATASELAGDPIGRFERGQREALAAALRPRVGKGAPAFAEVLDLVAAGAKHRAHTLEEYTAMLQRSVKRVLAPG